MKEWTAPDTITALIAGAALLLTTVEFVVSWRRAKQDRVNAARANTTTRAIAEMAQQTADRVAKAQEEQAGYATAQARREAGRDMRQRLEAFIEELEGRQSSATSLSESAAIQVALQDHFGHDGHDDGSAGALRVVAERIRQIRVQAVSLATNFAVSRITIEFAEKELRRLDRLLVHIGDPAWPPPESDRTMENGA